MFLDSSPRPPRSPSFSHSPGSAPPHRGGGWWHALTCFTAVGLAMLVAGCGETYVDSSITVPPTGVVTTVPAVTYDTAAPLPDLLDQISTLMFDLDERILDERHPAEALAAIDALWAEARPQIAADDATAATAFDEAIKLAHSGVERRRPADASKGYKIYLDLLEHYEQ